MVVASNLYSHSRAANAACQWSGAVQTDGTATAADASDLRTADISGQRTRHARHNHSPMGDLKQLLSELAN